MKHFSKKTFSSLMLSGLLASCAGQDSNPLQKYSGLKSAEPAPQTLETQTIASPDLFEVSVEGTNDLNQAQFIEGQNSQTLIRVISKSTKVSAYSIAITDFTSTDRPTLVSTADTNIYALQWAPPVGIGQAGKSLTATVLMTVTAAESPLLIGLAKIVKISVVVNRNTIQPQIIGRTDLKAGIDEGVDTKFTVDVEDKGAEGSPRLPEMQITPYIFSNTEAYRANASQAIALDDDISVKSNPEKIAPNRFRFRFVINFDRLPLNRDRVGHEIPAAPTVDVCFQMRAVSAVAILSDQIQVCTTARYAAQAPKFVFNEDQLKNIKSGEENSVTFKVSADHLSSVITLAKPLAQIAGLSGQKTMDCINSAADKKNELTCVLKWTPVCQKADSVKSLTLKADTTLGSKTKSTSEVKEITILAGANQCAKPTEGSK